MDLQCGRQSVELTVILLKLNTIFNVVALKAVVIMVTHGYCENKCTEDENILKATYQTF